MMHQPIKRVKLGFCQLRLVTLQEEVRECQHDARQRAEERCSLTFGKMHAKLISSDELWKVGQPVSLFLTITNVPFDQVDEKIRQIKDPGCNRKMITVNEF